MPRHQTRFRLIKLHNNVTHNRSGCMYRFSKNKQPIHFQRTQSLRVEPSAVIFFSTSSTRKYTQNEKEKKTGKKPKRIFVRMIRKIKNVCAQCSSERKKHWRQQHRRRRRRRNKNKLLNMREYERDLALWRTRLKDNPPHIQSNE